MYELIYLLLFFKRFQELKQELYQTKRQLEQSERLRNEIEQENSKLEEQIKILQCSFEVEKGEFIKNASSLNINLIVILTHKLSNVSANECYLSNICAVSYYTLI